MIQRELKVPLIYERYLPSLRLLGPEGLAEQHRDRGRMRLIQLQYWGNSTPNWFPISDVSKCLRWSCTCHSHDKPGVFDSSGLVPIPEVVLEYSDDWREEVDKMLKSREIPREGEGRFLVLQEFRVRV